MKDNIDRLLEAVEHTERFTDSELDELLETKETREMYGVMRKTSDALFETPVPDIDAEWHSFTENHARNTSWIFRVLGMRPAAAVAIGVIASIAVVAATFGIKNSLGSASQPVSTATDEVAGVSNIADSDSILAEIATTPETVVFRDATLEEIVDSLCLFYGVSAKFNGTTAKTLRLYFKWNQEQSLSEVVEQLNSFGRINIALQNNALTVE